MSKIICDICGTSYQDTADCCPICGCSKDAAASLLGEETKAEETVLEGKDKAGSFAPKKKKEIFDYDEANTAPKYPSEEDDDDEDEDDDDFDEEEDEDDEPRSNTFVVILLTILIAGLLIAAGFIFVKFFLPNMKTEEPVETTAAVQVLETTVPAETGVPCEYIAMNNAAKAELNEAGQQFLLNVLVKPENTTEQIVYTSGDESIATVSADGKITAVSEGQTSIYISCGKNSIECPVIVKYVEETTVPETEPVIVETKPAETEAPKETTAKPKVTLKLKQTDVSMGVYYYITLELDCDLKPTDVKWSSEDPDIASVDENGNVTAHRAGTTGIIAKYGKQEVQCIVRCS